MSIERQILDQTRDFLEGLEKKVEKLEISGGVDYNTLDNKPKINDIPLVGNKTLSDLDLYSKGQVDAKIPKVKFLKLSSTDSEYWSNNRFVIPWSALPSDLTNNSYLGGTGWGANSVGGNRVPAFPKPNFTGADNLTIQIGNLTSPSQTLAEGNIVLMYYSLN